MIVLDENVDDYERDRLRTWRIRAHKIGRDLGTKGIKDPQIIPFLMTLTRPTLFTLDDDFESPRLCHSAYCIVYLAVRHVEVATYVRRVLRHPALNTQAKRMGAVVRASEAGLRVWRRNEAEQALAWP
jgi:hypothetical protein